jgi:hypothetical protein
MSKFKLFWSFCQIIQTYSNDIESNLETNIPISLKWFLKEFRTAKITEARYLYVRFLTFWSIEQYDSFTRLYRNVLEHPVAVHDSVKQLFVQCLDLQPLHDRLQSCMIDITEWLIVHDQELIVTDMNSSPMAMRLYHEAWAQLALQPYTNPSNEFLHYVKRKVKDSKSSSDVLAHFIKSIREYISRIISRQQTMIKDENLITDPILKTLKQKAEQLLRVVLENVEDARISNVMRRAMSELILEIVSMYDADPFSGLHDACRSLQASLLQIDEEPKPFDEPPTVEIEPELSPLMQMLQQKKSNTQKSTILKLSVDELIDEDRFKSCMSIGQLEEEMNGDGTDGELILFDKMYNWVELDPIMNRLVQESDPTVQGYGVLSSPHSGRFQLTTSKILWYGIPKQVTDRAVELQEHHIWNLAISIPFADIQCFVVQPITVTEDVRLSSNQLDSGLSITDITQQMVMSFYTTTEVYRFFPFTSNEVHFLKDAFDQVARIRPVYQDHFIRKILSDRLFDQRRQILEQLLLQSKWLESSVEIQQCITNLTMEHQQSHQTQLELLFHSCRLESAVTNETIILIQVSVYLQ